jgi:hypothetical protein
MREFGTYNVILDTSIFKCFSDSGKRSSRPQGPGTWGMLIYRPCWMLTIQPKNRFADVYIRKELSEYNDKIHPTTAKTQRGRVSNHRPCKFRHALVMRRIATK